MGIFKSILFLNRARKNHRLFSWFSITPALLLGWIGTSCSNYLVSGGKGSVTTATPLIGDSVIDGSDCAASGSLGTPSVLIDAEGSLSTKVLKSDIFVPAGDELHFRFAFPGNPNVKIQDPISPSDITQVPAGSALPLDGGYINVTDIYLKNPGSVSVKFTATSVSTGISCTFIKTFRSDDANACGALQISEKMGTHGYVEGYLSNATYNNEVMTSVPVMQPGKFLHYQLITPWDETFTDLTPKPSFLQGSAAVERLYSHRPTENAWFSTVRHAGPYVKSRSPSEALDASSLDLNKITFNYSLPEGSESKFLTNGNLKPVFSKLYEFIKHMFQISASHPEAGDLYPPTLFFDNPSKTFGVVNENEGGQGVSVYRLPNDDDGLLISTRSFFCDALTSTSDRQSFYIPPQTITSGKFKTNELIFSIHATIPWKSKSCMTDGLRSVEIAYHIKVPSVQWSPTDARTGAKFPCR